MSVIYKYPLHLPETVIEISYNFVPLCVQVQNGKPHVWFLHPDLDAPKEKIKFQVIGTGQEFTPLSSYLGTFQIYEGALIFHVFYEKL